MSTKICHGLVLLLIAGLLLTSQDSIAQKNWKDQFQLSGYQKSLGSFYRLNAANASYYDLLLHNRLNSAWFISDTWTLTAQARTRFFWGDLVRLTPAYDEQIKEAADDYIRLGGNITSGDNYLLHTGLDRLNLKYSSGQWDLTVGRQRINWGMSTLWNLNDIFNVYSFLDFDYEERPGTDAVRIQFYPNFQSSLELVGRVFDNWDEGAIAMKYKWNQSLYDFQILAGWAQGFGVVGAGWAGNLKDAGFKGETSIFFPSEKIDETSYGLSWNVDYSWESGTYLNVGYLFNSAGKLSTSIGNLLDFELSARNIYPYRHTLLSQLAIPITPLLQSSMSVIYSPGKSHALFLNPFLSYSLFTNLDLDLIGQFFLNREDKKYTSPIQALFLRLKFSY